MPKWHLEIMDAADQREDAPTGRTEIAEMIKMDENMEMEMVEMKPL